MRMVDSNVLVDLREVGGAWRDWSFNAVAEARLLGPVKVSVVSIGELAVGGGSMPDVEALIVEMGMSIEPLGAAAAYRAGVAQHAYRKQGGRREKLLGDFLIGGHADAAGAALITRDARPYRRYFPDLLLITPETDHA